MTAARNMTLLACALGGAVALTCWVNADSGVPAKADENSSAEARAALRAFYSAPPVVPHVIRHQNSKQCMYCHTTVRHIGGRTTVRTPHVGNLNCQQCHVGVQVLNEDEPFTVVANSWLGLEEPREGDQAHDFAPPPVPHRIFMRENCNGCHGPDHSDTTMRGPHPERSNCLQCHVPSPENEFDIDPT